MFSLEEKKQYYRYPGSGWKFKTPPELPHDVARLMEREDLNGKYRFIWCGVDVVRITDDDLAPEVWGDRRACRYRKVQLGFTQRGSLSIPRYVDWLEPKQIFVNTRQIHVLFYLDDDGHRVGISRPEFAPPGKVVQIDYRFHSLGQLVWRMEEHLDASHPAYGQLEDWIAIGTIKAKDGSYAEPSVLHVQDLLKRRHEDRNRTRRELVAIAIAENAERDQSIADAELAAIAADEAEVREFVQTDFLPYVEKAPHSVTT